MATLSGGALLVECLKRQGVKTVFGVPGESYLPVLDALYDASPAIKTVMCRQEGGASYMAEAYSKFTGDIGVCLVTRGPGATNASIGVHTARQNSTAMILLVGHVGRDMMGREAFQEIDYARFFGDVAKWVADINSADRVPEMVARAFATACGGRPGPVVLSLPEDILSEHTSAEPSAPVQVAETGISSRTMDRFFNALASPRRPLVLVGGGGWNDTGRSDLKRFVEQNDLPVLAGFRWHDLLDNRSRSYAGDAAVGMTEETRSLLRDADLIIALGLELGEITTEGYSLLKVPHPRQRLIHVHAAAEELGKVYQPELSIQCGPNTFVAEAAAWPALTDSKWSDWRNRARQSFLVSLECPAQPGGVDMAAVMAWLREHLPGDVVITNGAGNFTLWPNKFFVYGDKARLLAPQSGAMGYGVPAAIAARIADPRRMVICFAGDGDFLMNGQELATARQYGAQPIILLLNNSMYGTIRMHQERDYPGRVHGTDLDNPDFGLLTRAYGIHYERVERTEDFQSAFESASKSETGSLIELIIDAEAITPRRTLSQIRKAAGGKPPV